MKSKLLILTVLSLFVVSSSFVASYATTSSQAWYWTQCNGVHVKASMTISAALQSDIITVTWNVPGYSWESFPCQRDRISSLNVDGYITAPGYTSVSFHCVSGSSANFCQFTAETETCTKYGCSSPHPYALQYGNTVTAAVTPTYGGFASHGHTFTMTVNS